MNLCAPGTNIFLCAKSQYATLNERNLYLKTRPVLTGFNTVVQDYYKSRKNLKEKGLKQARLKVIN